MDYSAYLKRINYEGDLNVSLDLLKKLQYLHLLHVPFENLDIHQGVEIKMENAFSKLVERGRGGFCYELNGAFFGLLTNIGFQVRLISGRVANKEQGFGEEFDHMAILAEIDGDCYLVDVGFGDFSAEPLKIMLNTLQHDRYGDFQMEMFDNTYLIVKKLVNDVLIPEYIFTEIARIPDDFREMCIYHQKSENSSFTKKKICSIATENGRITVTGDRLKIREGKEVMEKEFEKVSEFHHYLWKYFNIQLSAR
ncbi:N-hydroxyarylamine O-acetyltransferase [Pedobacter steynii]|uniref:N-hydroxyarylamine O-acetyltransferase n=1 Tax=Pedobacter steynii TaxID=430522 RepID=A0A1H0CZ41_9SPHI|nr:arylamine N-acetyltransferase [Pedobacter steynii]NQX41704.1 arylamine N-acetyltransferase [Pedobacter steynii]SDN63164.1 N-hydroxyarylamine O-acetyltransferase [Pedobacter steynii]